MKKKYRVYEGNKVLLETDDKEEAMRVWREAHRKQLNKFHEVHEYWDGRYNGTSQLAPGDCPDCGRRPESCKCTKEV